MSNLVEYISNQEGLFLPALSDESVSWEKKSNLIQALTSNDYLSKIATSNPTSLQNAIINIASIGISLNPALKHAYLVPRKGGVCLDLSYMGLLHLAQSSGVILWGQCKVVRANDTYQNTGLSKEPSHLSDTFGDRGEIVGAYCTVKTVDGDFLTEEMSIKEIFEIRARSEAFKKGNGPWKTDEGEMIRKTVVKRAYKYWPKCERLATAVQMINEQGEGISFEKNITPFIESPIKELQELLIDKNPEQYLPWLKVEKLEDVTEDQAAAAVILLRKKIMNIVDDIEQGSDDWLAARLGKITASRVSDVISKGRGNAPSKTAETYMIELIAEKLTGKSKPFFENEAMRWGTETEPQARAMYEVNNDFVTVREVAYIQLNDDVLMSPDGLIGDDGLLEIKTPNTTTQIKRALSDDYSADYKAQIQMQLWVSGRDWCDFVSFDPRLDCAASYLQQRVYRDEEYIAEMKEKVKLFTVKMNKIIFKLTGEL